MFKGRLTFTNAIVIAVTLRFIGSWTYSSWFHADEWYQSIEFSQLLMRGFGFYSQEFSFHLRNLLWPCLLSIPILVIDFFKLSSIQIYTFGFQFFIGLLDLSILWGFWILLHNRLKELPKNLNNSEKNFVINTAIALLILPWFTIWDSIRPSSEHLSAIAIWLTLGCLALRKASWAGFFNVAIFAFRYPSGLFSVGVALAIFSQALWHRPRSKEHDLPLKPFILGMLLGVCLLGLPDMFIYGHPWESLWMYLQYNVFTGLSSKVFGIQPISEYLEFFSWRWCRYGINFPLGIVLFIFVLFGICSGLKRKEPWAFGLIAYLLGHAAVPHKEPRFMLSVFTVLLWASIEGGLFLRTSSHLFFKTFGTNHYFGKKLLHPPHQDHSQKKLRQSFPLLNGLIGCLLMVNGLLTLRALWGETWTPASTYFDLATYLKSYPNTCAIITPRSLGSVLLPWRTLQDSKHLAIGWETMGNRRAPFFQNGKPALVHWFEQPPQCSEENQDVLLQLNFPEPEATKSGCKLLGSGILSILPKSTWPWIIQHEYSRGVWYRCDVHFLETLHPNKIVHPMATHLGRYTELPPFGIDGESFLNQARKVLPPPEGLDFITQGF